MPKIFPRTRPAARGLAGRLLRWLGPRLAVVLVGVGGCDRDEDARIPAGGDGAPRRGDRVVVEMAAAKFVEGQVIGTSGDRLRVQTAKREETIAVARGDAYVLPPAGQAHARGDLVICSPAAGQWVACRIEARDGATVAAVTTDGRRHRLAPDRVLVPSALTALNLRQHFERAKSRAAFARAVENAGVPTAPGGWTPSPRERVLGYRDCGWHAATIHELEDDGPYVRWSGTGRISKLPSSQVIPEPPYPSGVERGQYALTRPMVPAGAWEPVRVASVAEDAIVVVDVQNERREVAARDLVPLRPAR